MNPYRERVINQVQELLEIHLEVEWQIKGDYDRALVVEALKRLATKWSMPQGAGGIEQLPVSIDEQAFLEV